MLYVGEAQRLSPLELLPNRRQDSILACLYMDEKRDSLNLARILVTTMVVVSIVGLVALLAIGQSHKSSATGRSGLRLVGSQAPEFSIPSYQGGQVVLSGIRGRPVIINFWASWCPPCRAESAMLESLWREYEGTGIYFLGVNVQDSREAGEAYIEEFGITFVNGVDVDGRVSIDYGVIGLPATFFVDDSGMIVGRWVGAMSEQDLRVWVNDLLEKSLTTSRLDQMVSWTDQANPLH